MTETNPVLREWAAQRFEPDYEPFDHEAFKIEMADETDAACFPADNHAMIRTWLAYVMDDLASMPSDIAESFGYKITKILSTDCGFSEFGPLGCVYSHDLSEPLLLVGQHGDWMRAFEAFAIEHGLLPQYRPTLIDYDQGHVLFNAGADAWPYLLYTGMSVENRVDHVVHGMEGVTGARCMRWTTGHNRTPHSFTRIALARIGRYYNLNEPPPAKASTLIFRYGELNLEHRNFSIADKILIVGGVNADETDAFPDDVVRFHPEIEKTVEHLYDTVRDRIADVYERAMNHSLDRKIDVVMHVYKKARYHSHAETIRHNNNSMPVMEIAVNAYRGGMGSDDLIPMPKRLMGLDINGNFEMVKSYYRSDNVPIICHETGTILAYLKKPHQLWVLYPMHCMTTNEGRELNRRVLSTAFSLLKYDECFYHFSARKTDYLAKCVETLKTDDPNWYLDYMIDLYQGEQHRLKKNLEKQIGYSIKWRNKLLVSLSEERELHRKIKLYNDAPELRQKMESEIAELGRNPKIKSIEYLEDMIMVTTRTLFCWNPRHNDYRRIGRMQITFSNTGRDLSNFDVKYFNLDKTDKSKTEMQAVHVFEDGRPCLGNMNVAFPELLANNDIAALISLAVDFAESINFEDSCANDINKWPVARPEEVPDFYEFKAKYAQICAEQNNKEAKAA